MAVVYAQEELQLVGAVKTAFTKYEVISTAFVAVAVAASELRVAYAGNEG